MEKFKQLIDLQLQRLELSGKIKDLQEEIIPLISPYKEGQIVPAQSIIHKDRNARIEDVTLVISNEEIRLQVKATKINHDGSEGTQLTWSSVNDMLLATALQKHLSKYLIEECEWYLMDSQFPGEIKEGSGISDVVFVRNETEISTAKYDYHHGEWIDITIKKPTHWLPRKGILSRKK